MRIAIGKKYIMLLTTASVTTAALAAGAYSYRAPDWSNSAIKDLATTWGVTNSSRLASETGRVGNSGGFPRIAVNNADFAFLWSNPAMKNLGTLPTVTFNRPAGIIDASGIVKQAVSGPVSHLAGNTARTYAEAAGPAYGSSLPSLSSKGTIDDPSRQSPINISDENPNGGTPVPTPLPAALSLFGSGLAWLGLMRRKMKS